MNKDINDFANNNENELMLCLLVLSQNELLGRKTDRPLQPLCHLNVEDSHRCISQEYNKRHFSTQSL